MVKMMLHSILFFELLIIFSVDGFGYEQSFFTKVSIIDDICAEDIDAIDDETVNDNLECAMLCNQNPDCRRYLFCAPSCKLYPHGEACLVNGPSPGCMCFKKNIGCNENGCRCPLGQYGDKCENYALDCFDAVHQHGVTHYPKALVNIQPSPEVEPFEVYCMLQGDIGTAILRRTQFCNFLEFNRTLQEYEEGFGLTPLNRWIGFNKIMHLLNHPKTKIILYIHLYKPNWSNCHNMYTGFDINYVSGRYEFNSTRYLVFYTACGDSMTDTKDLRGKPFSTYDMDYTGANECAKRFGGGWWYDNDAVCTESFLMGTMGSGGTTRNFWNVLNPAYFIKIDWWLRRTP